MRHRNFERAEISTDRHISTALGITSLGKKISIKANARWPVVIRQSHWVWDAKTAHISTKGAFIVCSDPLRLGTTFTLALKLPAAEAPLVCRATVVWSVRSIKRGPYRQTGMGVRFDDISSDDTAVIAVAIARAASSGDPLGPKW